MVIVITVLLSLFTGLYGPGAQSLADTIEREVEGLAHVELRGGCGVEDVLEPLTGNMLPRCSVGKNKSLI